MSIISGARRGHHTLVKKMLNLICTAAIVLGLGQHTVATFDAQEATCGLKYQDILKEAISLQKRCDNAAYRDCCQVQLLYYACNKSLSDL